MTLSVRDVIKRANRLFGGIASGDDPTNDELTDALLSYNAMTRALYGVVIGPRLAPVTMTGTTGQAENGALCMIPASLFTLTAPSNPKGGARFGVVDANLNFTTNACTVNRNGRLLEGAAANLNLNTSGTNRQWWFRPDTGNWVKEADALIDDNAPFADPLNAYLPAMLATYIQAEFGGDIRQDVVIQAAEGRQALARAYGRRGRNQLDAPINVPDGMSSPQR